VSDLAQSSEIVKLRGYSDLGGVTTPRIHTKLNNLDSKGESFIKFCERIGHPLLPWQQWLAYHSLKINPDGTWKHPIVGLVVARQNGKSTFMALQILWRIYELDEKLQVHTAHKLTTSSEIFYKVNSIIEQTPELEAQFVKKLESKGFQELQFTNGRRYIVRANNSAGRGIAAPNTIHLDEAREYREEEVWAALRYTQMASPNPQAWIYSNMGDKSSIILNKLRDRAIASTMGVADDIGWFEWSADPSIKFDNSPEFWFGVAQANPSLGHTIS